LDCGLISLITFYLTTVFYGILNVIQPKKHPILISLFIVPAIVSAFDFWLGKHLLGVYLV